MTFSPALEIPTTVRFLVDRMALSQSNFTFLISAERGLTVTYKEFQVNARNLYFEFQRLGLEHGDKIALMMDNSVPAAELLLGTMYGGFVAVPLNVRAGAAQLSYMLEHSDATIVFAEDKYRPMLAEVIKDIEREFRVISVDADKSMRSSEPSIMEPLPALQADQPALLMYSSGTTGVCIKRQSPLRARPGTY
jgi:acyl-CoA synthetase (AMP-forming)/AMP-acid ligase II